MEGQILGALTLFGLIYFERNKNKGFNKEKKNRKQHFLFMFGLEEKRKITGHFYFLAFP